MYEATITVEGSGAYADATIETGARIELWCAGHCDLLRVVGSVVDQLEASVGVRDTLGWGNEMIVVTDDCLRNHADVVDPYFARHGCLLLPPLRYEDGTKQCRLLALDPGALTACYRELVDDGVSVTVKSKHSVESVSPPLNTFDGVISELTQRQRETLRTAHEQGYYRIPRETTMEAIATTIGVDRRTAAEHLRRAENKLIDALVEYV